MLSWVMDEFTHWPKPYLLLSASCDEYIVTDDWNLDEKTLGVSDSYCNTVTSQKKIYKEWQMMLG